MEATTSLEGIIVAEKPSYEELEKRIQELEQTISESKQAETLMRESDERYRSFVQNFRGIAFRGKMDFTPFFFHGAVEEITGYTEAEFVGGKPRWDQIVHPDDQPAVLQEMANKICSVPGYFCERDYRIIRKDGQVRWVHEIIQNICDNEELPIAVQGSIYDITERKRAEDALKKSEERTRSVVENSPVGIAIFDEPGQCYIANDSLGNMLGATKEQILALNYNEIEAWKVYGVLDKAKIVLKDGISKRFELIAASSFGKTVQLDCYLVPFGSGQLLFMGHDISERKQAEEALRKSEEQYRRLTTNARDMIYRQSLPDGKYEYVNPASVEILGYSPEEICNEPMHIRKTIHPDWKDYLEKQWESLLKGDAPPYFEFQIVSKSGDVKWIHQRNLILYDENGQPIATEGIATDITDLKRAEKHRRESETLYRSVLETIDGGIVLQAASGEILIWNSGAEKILGLPANDAVGQTSESRNWNTVHEDGSKFEAFDHPSMRTLRTGEPCRNETMGIYRPSGELRWVNINTTPLFVSDENQPYAVAISFSDITELKNVEQVLRRSETRYRELFNNTRSGVAIYDVVGNGDDFIFKDFNRTGELLDGSRREDLIGKSIFEVRPGIEEFGLLEVFRRVWATGKPESVPAALYQDNRLAKWYENFVYRLPSGEIVAVFDDVTERKEAEEEIKEKSEHLTEVNAALRALLRQREEDKKEHEEEIFSNIKHLVVPYLESLKKSHLTANQKSWIEALETNLNQVTSTFTRKLTLRDLNLSNAELRVAALVRDGKSTKEIAEILIISEKTVASHRDSIRKKLGLRGKKGGLRYLLRNPSQP